MSSLVLPIAWTPSRSGSTQEGLCSSLRWTTYFGLRVLSKRLAVICDTSGSMSAQIDYDGKGDTRIEALKSELLKMVKTFKKRTYFNIYVFTHAYKKLFKQLTLFSRSSYGRSKKFVEGLGAAGGTNLYDPLEEALNDPYVDTIYLLSDGAPGSGKYTKKDDILRAVRKINKVRAIQIHTISIGTDSDLMRELAERNGGQYRFIK